MELESSLYCVWLLSYLHFCVAEPGKPPLQVCNTDETLQGANMDVVREPGWSIGTNFGSKAHSDF